MSFRTLGAETSLFAKTPTDELMQHTITVVEGTRAVWLSPQRELEVVGESFNMEHLATLIAAGQQNRGFSLVAWLVPEPQNAYDPNAVMVWLCGGRVGYLARTAARAWQGELLTLIGEHQAQVACLAEIRGTESPSVWLRVPADSPLVPQTVGSNEPSRMASGSAEFRVDLNEVLEDLVASDPEFAEQLNAYVERRERFLASMSTEERAAYEAKQQREHEERLREDAERQEEFEAEQRAKEERHAKIEADRVAGLVGTQTELGRPYGLSAVAVGRILDEHGLRERIAVLLPGYQEPLTLMRGVSLGYAIFDEYSGREYWIVSKVVPLLAEAGVRKK
jgi:hypothetical protein